MNAPVAAILRSRRLRRWAVGGALVVVALVGVPALVAAVLVQRPPSWWRAVHRDDPRTLDRARGIEDRAFSELTAVRPADEVYASEHPESWGSEVWTFRVDAPEANAWLNARLPQWLANQDGSFRWPGEIGEVQVDFEDAEVRVGMLVHAVDRDHIVSATLTPRVGEDGSLWLPARWVQMGRLALPASWVLEKADARRAEFLPASMARMPETDGMFRAFAGELPIARNAVVRLDDGRRVRLLSITPRDGTLYLTCRTELPVASRR